MTENEILSEMRKNVMSPRCTKKEEKKRVENGSMKTPINFLLVVWHGDFSNVIGFYTHFFPETIFICFSRGFVFGFDRAIIRNGIRKMIQIQV